MRQAGQTDTRFLDSSPKPEGGIGGEIEKEIGAVGDLRQHPVFEAELVLSKHGRGRRQYDLGALERFAQDAQAPQVHAANMADDLPVNAPREVGFGGGERNGVSNLGFFIDGYAFLRFFAGNGRPNQLGAQRLFWDIFHGNVFFDGLPSRMSPMSATNATVCVSNSP